MRTIATVLATLAVLLGASAFAQETTIEVPQGSGVFPTVGQVNCLEELGSGRLCAATYECSGESGRLWGDFANHDGRRAIGADSPVARGRDCTVTVDGRAAVQWLIAYSPAGRDGELVGLAAQASTTQVEAASEPWTVTYTKSVNMRPRRIIRNRNVTVWPMEIVGVRWQYDTGNDTRVRAGTFRAALHCPPPFAPMDANATTFMAGDSNALTLSLKLLTEEYERLYIFGVSETTYRCWIRVNARIDDEDDHPVEYSTNLPVDVISYTP